jgi:protein unc-45
LLKIFTDAYSSKNETALLSAVEGLAFSSTVAQTKEELTKDPKFLKSLLEIINSSGREHTLVYGCISILVNLTSYKRPLTEEEKRVNEIHRLAKETNVHTVDELDDNAHVTSRCETILSAGLLPALNTMAVNSSPACITAIAHILLSVSTAPTHRFSLAQQGAIKLILALLGRPIDQNTEVTLSHALAKILISVNPSLVFSSRTPITTPIHPLAALLTNESLPNELPRFETLLALTNLASVDHSARNTIVDKAWTVTETLLLSDIPLLQRAATELVCNLVVSQKGAEKFLPSKTSSAISRLHLLLALADVDDVATRSAAGGALAILTDLNEICHAIGEVERGVERICGMVGDGNEDVAYRGIICVNNLIENGNSDLKTRISAAGTVSKIQELKTRTTNDKLKGLYDKLKGLCDRILGVLA